jgi:hypothetical protein
MMTECDHSHFWCHFLALCIVFGIPLSTMVVSLERVHKILLALLHEYQDIHCMFVVLSECLYSIDHWNGLPRVGQCDSDGHD